MQFLLSLIVLAAGTASALPMGAGNKEDGSPSGVAAVPSQGGDSWGSWPTTTAIAPAVPQGGSPSPAAGGNNVQVNSPAPSPSPMETAPAGGNNGQVNSPAPTPSPSPSPMDTTPVDGQHQAPKKTALAPSPSPSPMAGQKSNVMEQKEQSPAPQDSTPSATIPSPRPAFTAPAAALETALGSPPSSSCPWDFVLSCAQQASQQTGSCMNILAQGTSNCFSDSTCAGAIGSDAPNCASCYTDLGKPQFVKAVFEEKSNSNVAPVFQVMVSNGVCDDNGNVLNN